MSHKIRKAEEQPEVCTNENNDLKGHHCHSSNGSNCGNGSNGTNGTVACQQQACAKRHKQDEEWSYQVQDDEGELVIDENKTINGATRPVDWPLSKGEIDLAVHDLPHGTSDTEWWYVHSHLQSAEGKQFSVFAAFFRIVLAWDHEKQCYEHTHALIWAVIDLEHERYLADPLLDKYAPKVIKYQLENNMYRVDPRIRRALIEIVDKENVPAPDHLIPSDVQVALDKLQLNYGEQKFYKDSAGNYTCECECKSRGFGFSLKFTPKKKPTRYGHGGVVKIGVKGDDMFYYFIPRNDVTGTLWTDQQPPTKVTGSGWYDHEFGGRITAPKTDQEKKQYDEDNRNRVRSEYGWNWLALQLDDGTDITATTVIQPHPDGIDKGYTICDNFALVVDKNSNRRLYKDAELKGSNPWTSSKTTNEYPLEWQLVIPEAQIDIQLKASFPNQEFISTIARPAFWEGRLSATGTIVGHAVKGKAFFERHGFQDTTTMDSFFKKMNKIVRDEIDHVLVATPTYENVRNLIADDTMDHYLKGADIKVYSDWVIRPIREIVDRGGKSWRSYAITLAIDCVGGDSTPFIHLMAMPEIMHVGSLIVDDIQDRSDLRRGGPTCHKLYGEPVAINCGTAAYFLPQYVLEKRVPMTKAQRLRLYELYFLTLRAGHAGQAFDIVGVDYLIPDAIETGDNKRLEETVLCTHRLKSAAPAGNLARMGGTLGNGTPEQINKIGGYFESIGVAFQIIDDVLNLRGLPGKTRGEDLTMGKITYPVAKCFSKARLKTKEEREKFYQAVKAKPSDPVEVDKLIKVIEDCGALQAANDEACEMVEAAWKELDPVIPDSYFKMNLRAFGWYVLERHY